MPASIPCLMLSGVTMSVTKLVAGGEHPQRAARDQQQAYSEHAQADSGRDVGDAEEAVPKAVDQIEEWIRVRQGLPHRGQRMHGIEDTGKEGERHDDEVLECRELVDLLRQDSGYQAQRAEEGR